MLKDQVREHILSERLFLKEDLLLVALSGGPDSVALVHVLLELGYTFEAMHCNFHLRGKESDRDEAFCRELCATYGIMLHTVDFDTIEYAKTHHQSIEMAARELRYGYFEKTRKLRKASCILTAHHQDDSIETVLLNIVQGTGIKGLSGIKPKNGAIVRPLLSVSRKQIMGYLEEGGWEYVLDSTNQEDICKRNIIRNHLIPLLEEINPGARGNILRTAANLREAGRIYDAGIIRELREIEKEEGVISIPELKKSSSPESLLFERLHPLGFNASQIRDMIRGLDAEGSRTFLSQTHMVIKDRERLLVSSLSEAEEDMPRLKYEKIIRSRDLELPHDNWSIMIDMDKVTEPLELRKVTEGDWMIPLGMRGRKLLSDMMSERKYSALDKRRQCVLCCKKDIVWALGLRIDERYKVTDNTERILRISVIS